MARPKKQPVKEPKEYGGYLLVNHDKLDRAINGNIGREGRLTGGVGKDAPLEAVLAEYDRLGGLILDADNNRLETGSFYDFDKGAPRTQVKPERKAKPEALSRKRVSEDNTDGDDKPRRKKRSPADDD